MTISSIRVRVLFRPSIFAWDFRFRCPGEGDGGGAARAEGGDQGQGQGQESPTTTAAATITTTTPAAAAVTPIFASAQMLATATPAMVQNFSGPRLQPRLASLASNSLLDYRGPLHAAIQAIAIDELFLI